MEKIKKLKEWTLEQILWAEKNLKDKDGPAKKKAVLAKLDELIKLPCYLEWMDDLVISWLIDKTCKYLNEITAHNFSGLTADTSLKEKVAANIQIFDLANTANTKESE